jgi:transposase
VEDCLAAHPWWVFPIRVFGYVEQCLARILTRDDMVVMDNLPAHKVPGVREAIENVRATLRYLPQHSPDLNPIEMEWSCEPGKKIDQESGA